MFDPAYLGRSLDNRLPDIYESVTREVKALQNKHAAAGRLQSGATLIAFEDIAVNILKTTISDASKFTFEFTGGHEPEALAYLKNFAGRVQHTIMSEISEKADRLSLGDATANHLHKVRTKLDRLREQALDDFSHGMQGSERLKKDAVVNIVANQTGNGIQQIGVGNFSQKAFVENHQQLIDAIAKALASSEFAKLLPQHKEGFKDIADTLLEEAKKPTPDPGKLKRWGARLGELSVQLGLEVAASEIVELIGQMFP
ncbi:hypothetical protein [Rhodopseudomonas sp. RCAM05734]|uniref:hypothetical protein n=1 Tax=Rhodopseudomonas sp. RCAM05734 TaxID=3457549 RepID=UPI0040449AA2